MEKVIYLTNGSAALSESYQQVESLKGTGKSKNLRAHHTAMQPIRSKEDFDKFCTYFLSNHNYRDYALFIVGIELGTLRSCDLLKLRIKDVYDGKEFRDTVYGVVEQKTGKIKNVYIPDGAKTALKLYLSHRCVQSLQEPLFISRKGNQLSERQAREILSKAAKAIGVTYPVAMHTLRKTWGYHTFINHKNDNMALMDIMKSYNHSAPGITLRYIGMDEEHRKEMCMGFEIKGEDQHE